MLSTRITVSLLIFSICSVAGNEIGYGGNGTPLTTYNATAAAAPISMPYIAPNAFATCGIRPQITVARARVIGGTNSTPGAWPWQAALYRAGDPFGHTRCSATLISSQWLISAAHCFYGVQNVIWWTRLGTLRPNSIYKSPDEQVRFISKIFIHPEFINEKVIFNDISLLRMEEPVHFTDFIRPVCLPPPMDVIRDGRMCTVTGWGKLHEAGKEFPDILQQVQLPLVSTEECKRKHPNITESILMDKVFCTGFDELRGGCLGDSGGPLTCEETDGRWTLQGVISAGNNGCVGPNTHGIYTKVTNYITWIVQVVNGTF